MKALRTGTPAIAFDFDGTLIDGGLDKGIHIMFSVWSAFLLNSLDHYLHGNEVGTDIDRMLAAYVKYPGAPRFQQLSALANSLVRQVPESVEESSLSVFPSDVQKVYPNIKAHYNRTYSGLNDTAAERYWKPFPSVHQSLRRLSRTYDLYIASGVTEDLLYGDLKRHSFDESLFSGIFGGNTSGGADKAELLGMIRKRGYPDILFVADSNRDLLYAQHARARFFRIRENEDFDRLMRILRTELPDEQQNWSYTPQELEFFHKKTEAIIRNVLLTGRFEDYGMMTGIIHDSEGQCCAR